YAELIFLNYLKNLSNPNAIITPIAAMITPIEVKRMDKKAFLPIKACPIMLRIRPIMVNLIAICFLSLSSFI
ncbi:MAG: hypothetical protein K8R49_02640, partial [Candidatus Cloacimonetes bacterium]|nr:hypothetical protein [Candidatus Cloacimonadota bacterium]